MNNKIDFSKFTKTDWEKIDLRTFNIDQLNGLLHYTNKLADEVRFGDGRITPENRERIMKEAAEQAHEYCEAVNNKKLSRSHIGETANQKAWRLEAEAYASAQNRKYRPKG